MTKRNLITVPIYAEANLYFKELKNEVIAYYFELSGLSAGADCNKILAEQSGLCSAREFDLLQDCPENIIGFKTQDLKGYTLWTKDIKEAVRNGVVKNELDEIKYEYSVFMPDFVFEDSEKFDKDNIIVGRIDSDKEYFYEYRSNIPYIKKMYFDFFNGVVTDENYNLEKVINTLSKRNDIIWSNKEPINITGMDNVKYISFYWNPSEKDWDKFVKSDCFKEYHYYRYNWVLENILGLRRKDKDEKNIINLKNDAIKDNDDDIDNVNKDFLDEIFGG